MNTAIANAPSKAQLDADLGAFVAWLDELDQPRRSPITGAHDTRDRVIAQGLKSHGLARWDGFVDDATTLESLRNHARRILERSAAIAKTLPPSGRAVDEMTGAEIWRGCNLADGRTRANFTRGSVERCPTPLASLFNDERIAAVVRTYYGAHRAWCNALLVERLAESRTADAWHFDKLFDQIKVMILLGDTTEANGPLRYKSGTHRRPRALDGQFHRSFVGGAVDGLAFNYPDAEIVESIEGDTVLATGEAGDAIFFDTLGIHSGTLCTAGERLALVCSFNIATPRNEALYRLFFPDRV